MDNATPFLHCKARFYFFLVAIALLLAIVAGTDTAIAAVIANGNATTSNPVLVGVGGNTGTLEVNGGSQLTSPDNSFVGSGANSDGELLLTGAGSTFAVGGGPGSWFFVGDNESNGRLTIENSAVVSVDAFSSTDFSEGRIDVGNSGIGTLTIRSSGQLIMMDSSNTGNGNGMYIGRTGGWAGSDAVGNGVVTVQDEGSMLTLNGVGVFINVGATNTQFTGTNFSNGTLNINNGADVVLDGSGSFGSLTIARGPKSNGAVNISGVGTTLTLTGTTGGLFVTNDFFVGPETSGGMGILNVSDGAVVDMSGSSPGESVFFVSYGLGHGVAVIDTGAEVNVDGDVTVSSDSPTNTNHSGSLFVNDAATLNAHNTIVGTGAIAGGTGTYNSNVTVSGGGIFQPGSSIGETTLNGDFLSSDGVLEIEVAGIAGGEFDVINISGGAEFSGGIIRVRFLDGFVPNVGDTVSFLNASSVVGLETVRYEVEGLPDDKTLDFSTDGFTVQFRTEAQIRGLNIILIKAALDAKTPNYRVYAGNWDVTETVTYTVESSPDCGAEGSTDFFQVPSTLEVTQLDPIISPNSYEMALFLSSISYIVGKFTSFRAVDVSNDRAQAFSYEGMTLTFSDDTTFSTTTSRTSRERCGFFDVSWSGVKAE